MEEAFVWVAVGTLVVGVVVAVVISLTGGSGHDRIGRGGLSLDAPDRPPPPPPGSAMARSEAEEEVLQLVEAKSARREARGLPPLDIDAEIRAVKRAAAGPRRVDPALRGEIRGLVEARNERRARRGKPPLDVEEEIDRRARELGG